jgi:acetyl-CoA C-acetyltransferase
LFFAPQEAAVFGSFTRFLPGVNHEGKLNVNGGAIAIGHPLGATGVRLTLTLARELRRSGLRYGIASACIGGGQGIALLVENTSAAGAA